MWGSTPTAGAYNGPGRLDTHDPAFTATFDEVAQGLAAYLREAMDHYAETNL